MDLRACSAAADCLEGRAHVGDSTEIDLSVAPIAPQRWPTLAARAAGPAPPEGDAGPASCDAGTAASRGAIERFQPGGRRGNVRPRRAKRLEIPSECSL